MCSIRQSAARSVRHVRVLEVKEEEVLSEAQRRLVLKIERGGEGARLILQLVASSTIKGTKGNDDGVDTADVNWDCDLGVAR